MGVRLGAQRHGRSDHENFGDPDQHRDAEDERASGGDAKLLDRVLLKYDWLREQNELRTKPSASEHRLDLRDEG
jgi:hypothetical protein